MARRHTQQTHGEAGGWLLREASTTQVTRMCSSLVTSTYVVCADTSCSHEWRPLTLFSHTLSLILVSRMPHSLPIRFLTLTGDPSSSRNGSHHPVPRHIRQHEGRKGGGGQGSGAGVHEGRAQAAAAVLSLRVQRARYVFVLL